MLLVFEKVDFWFILIQIQNVDLLSYVHCSAVAASAQSLL